MRVPAPFRFRRKNRRAKRPPAPPAPALVRIGNVEDEDLGGGASDASGLVMRHELDAKAQAAVEKIGNALARAQQKGPWLIAAAGALTGLGVAGAIWWFSRKPAGAGAATSKAKKRKKAKRKG